MCCNPIPVCCNSTDTFQCVATQRTRLPVLQPTYQPSDVCTNMHTHTYNCAILQQRASPLLPTGASCHTARSADPPRSRCAHAIRQVGLPYPSRSVDTAHMARSVSLPSTCKTTKRSMCMCSQHLDTTSHFSPQSLHSSKACLRLTVSLHTSWLDSRIVRVQKCI